MHSKPDYQEDILQQDLKKYTCIHSEALPLVHIQCFTKVKATAFWTTDPATLIYTSPQHGPVLQSTWPTFQKHLEQQTKNLYQLYEKSSVGMNSSAAESVSK